MSEDISEAIRVAIVVLLAASLLATILQITIPATSYLTTKSDQYTTLAAMDYNQMKNFSGKELNATRVYRYVMETYMETSTVIIREHPVTEPNNYKVIVSKENVTNLPGCQSAIDAFPEKDTDEMYTSLAQTFNRQYVNDKFRLTVVTTPSGGLEVLCDVVDEYYD